MTYTNQNSHIIDIIAIADTLRRQGKFQEAVNYYRESLNKGDKDFLTYIKMGDAILAQRNPTLFPISLACYRQSLHLNANNPKAYIRMSIVLKKLGRQAESLAAAKQAQSLAPELIRTGFTLLDTLFPVLYEKAEDIASCRSTYERHLNELSNTIPYHNAEAMASVARAVGISPYYLTYQGYNDVHLQRCFGEMICGIQALMYPQWSKRIPPPPQHAGEPLRVGIVSSSFHTHSNWKMRIRGWLEAINRKRISLYGYYTDFTYDSCTEIARHSLTRFVEHDFSMASLCRKIRGDNLHALIYPGIGMNPIVGQLASLRLAPVQCTTWGNPTTSGLPTIDYFLSSALMEPPDGDNHYTETLIRLPNLSVYYTPLDTKPAKIDRNQLGLQKDRVLFLCMQNLVKYLPQYDDVFPRIAKRVENSQFVFLASKKTIQVVNIFKRRMTETFARYGLNSEHYVTILPHLDEQAYAALNQWGDIFLDGIGWSGCNTTLEAIAWNLPVVTFPGNLMRGRHSMAFLKMMGLTDTIADSLDHYVELAIRLGRDRQWRQQIRDQVATNKHKLYADMSAIESLENFLEKAVADLREHWQQ